MVGAVLAILGSALSIWDSKEKTKYVDRVLFLKKEWYEEINKPENDRDDSVLDHIEWELNLLCHTVASLIGAQNSPSQ